MKKNLPFELINQIIIMRPTRPIVILLREYCIDKSIFEPYDNMYCKNVCRSLQSSDLLFMNHFDYRYKNYIRIKQKFIERFYRLEIKEIEFLKKCVKKTISIMKNIHLRI